MFKFNRFSDTGWSKLCFHIVREIIESNRNTVRQVNWDSLERKESLGHYKNGESFLCSKLVISNWQDSKKFVLCELFQL